MPLVDHLSRQIFVLFDEAADHEKSGFHTEFIQYIQNAFGHAWYGTIIERQCDQFSAPTEFFDSSSGHRSDGHGKAEPKSESDHDHTSQRNQKCHTKNDDCESPSAAGFNHFLFEYRPDWFQTNGFHSISMLFGGLITFSLQFDRFIR